MAVNGLNYQQQNMARRMRDKGWADEAIARYHGATVESVKRYFASLMAGESDQFGPLPGSSEWDELSPGAKSGLTRKRNFNNEAAKA